MRKAHKALSYLLSFLFLLSGAACTISCNPEEPEDVDYGFAYKPTEEPEDPAADPVRTFRYVNLKAMGHPRLLITNDGFDDLKEKVTIFKDRYTKLYQLHNLAIQQANEICANTSEVIEYKLDSANKRLLTQSRKALKRLFICSYAYKMTKEMKYLNKVRADLRTVCSFSDWHPSHYLDVGEMALAVAITYDWLYSDLGYDERVMARKALKEYALETSLDQGFHTSKGNWNQVCNAGVMAAALVTYEQNKVLSVNVIEKGLESNKDMMQYIYSPDGNYAEGYNYWGYGTGFQTIINMMLMNAFDTSHGINDIPGFLKTDGYMLFMNAPKGCFPYSDGGNGNERGQIGMWYFAGLKDDPSLLYNELRLLDKGQYADAGEIRILPAAIIAIRNANNLDSGASTPNSRLWHGNGLSPVIMVHTSWTYGEDDHYLGIKGGAAKNGHGHMDAGSFVYDALGERWSDDYLCPGYATMENALGAVGGSLWTMTQQSMRWDIFKLNNLAHSTLSVMNNDGSEARLHPSDHIATSSATIKKVIESSSELGGTLNMTPIYKGQLASAERTVKLVNEKDLIVIDVLKATDGMDAQVQWRMLTPAVASIGADAITLTQNGKTMYLKASSSECSPTLSEWTPGRPADWTARTWDSGFSGTTLVGYAATIPAGKTCTITTVLSPEK